MHHSGIKSIRAKLTLTVVLFTAVILVSFTALMFSVFSREQRKSTLQNTEYNLQLVAGVIDQNLEKLQTLSLWSVGNSSLLNYLRSEDATGMDGIRAYQRISEEWQSNRASDYVRRFVVSDCNNKLLQVGSGMSNDIPVARYQMHMLLADMAADVQPTYTLGADTLARENTQSLLVIRPILLHGGEGGRGLSYMAISPSVITDQLKNYKLLADDSFYFTIVDTTYQIKNDAFIPVSKPTNLSTSDLSETLNAQTIITKQTDGTDGTHIVISYPLATAKGLYLSHSLSDAQFLWTSSRYALLLTCICVLVLLFGIALVFYLNRIINRPVTKLRNRIAEIAQGDFSNDPDIEWNNELGDVGHGINMLSHNVVELMDNRLADEKAKRDLEYQMLQNQINPHFIYNTLNSIKWMATIQNATGIAEMTTAFSHLLKSVAKGNEELIPLREEFALLNDYCTIQQYRYGGSISLEIAEISDEALCDCLIPRFTLQPLAENAIFHGIEPKGGVGSIWLHISQTETGDICIVMEDDGVGMTQETIAAIFNAVEEEPKKYKQIGVRNVHRRIQYAFGTAYGITIESEIGKFTRMRVLLPCRYATRESNT